MMATSLKKKGRPIKKKQTNKKTPLKLAENSD
jgi:hypothetical protein